MHHAIQTYYRKLDDLRRIAGAENEGALRSAFQTLLDTLGQEQGLILYNEYQLKTANGALLRIDGALIDRLRLVHGYWEAKDEKDDLDKEIEAKLATGYPNDNIIFEDTRSAVLLQNGQQVVRCDMSHAAQLHQLLEQFFTYEVPEVTNFRLAKLKFLSELPQVAAALTQLLHEARLINQQFRQRAMAFLHSCQISISKQVTLQHIDEMLIQHILTDEIFRAIFPYSRFHNENHLARAINELEQIFFHGNTRVSLLKRLEPYFAAIRQAAANTTNSIEKQNFLKQVYEDFYTAYNPKDADKLGVVYTPQEVVRFIIEGCDWLTQKHFNKRLADNGLEILDPCMGTGTFIVDLLDYWRGDHRALQYKFTNELHANEISILPYYIANLNIEQTYYEITGYWQEFSGACFINTLNNWGFTPVYSGAQSDLFGSITEENKLRLQQQNQRKIPVIIGNPPYNANQQNENDENKNDPAPIVDKRIKDTYLAASTAQKTKLYDPYIRFFRWASDRIGEKGVLAFISNRSYLDSRQADGFRKTIVKEFQEIWIVDLLGDLRNKDNISLNQGGSIFNIQTGVAISFLMRNPQLEGCEIHYIHVPEGISGTEKLNWLKHNLLPRLARNGQFTGIMPNKQGMWLNQPTEDWSAFLPVASKQSKNNNEVIFKLYSLGVVTARDEWVYGMNKTEVKEKVRFFINHYESIRTNSGSSDTIIKWSRAVKNDLSCNVYYKYDDRCIVESIYRPFIIRKLYFNKKLNEMPSKQRKIFPKGVKFKNLVICFSFGRRSKDFSCLATQFIPSLDVFLPDANNCLPLFQYAEDDISYDNITDWAVTQFHTHYNDTTINKLDIFHYVYTVLHDPRYRKKYALNLKTEFPRIPLHTDFFTWANIGAQLVKLHAYFEQVQPYPLQRVEVKSGIIKVKLKADKIKHRIEIDSHTTLMNIPAPAWQYQLGNRSALEWVLDQYKEKTPTDATIREKFSTYRFANYKEPVIELLGKVCQVSVETMELIQKIEQLEW